MLTDAVRVLAISLCLLLYAEMSLRLIYPERVQQIADLGRRIEGAAFVFDADALIALKPGVHKTYRRTPPNGGDVIAWRTNSDSFRGRELRPDPEARIMVYGDSNIQARFSALEHTFSYRLEQRLASLSGRDVEVINAGIVGAGPDQSLIRLSTDIDRYHPDLVVFHVFADNDFGDLVRNRLFELDASGQLVRTTFEASVDQSLQIRAPRLLLVLATRDLIESIWASRSGPGPVAEVPVEETIEKLVATNDAEYAVYESRGPRSYSHFDDHYDIDIALQPDGKSAREKSILMERILAEAKALTDSRNVKLLVLIQPASRDLTQNLRPNYSHLQKHPDYRRDRLSSLVKTICMKLGIHHVNLYPVFLRNQPDALFFAGDDDHWNDIGQDLAARKVANYIHRRFVRREER